MTITNSRTITILESITINHVINVYKSREGKYIG